MPPSSPATAFPPRYNLPPCPVESLPYPQAQQALPPPSQHATAFHTCYSLQASLPPSSQASSPQA